MVKQTKFFKIICAFQHFGGKPLRSLDACEVVTDEQIKLLIIILKKIAAWCEKQDKEQWKDLHRLAIEIRSNLEGID